MATTFKDCEGREWHVKVTIGAVDRILEMCRVTIGEESFPLDLYDEDHFAELLKNQRVACAALCATILPQLQAANVTSEQFRDALDGDAVANGLEAFWESVVNFSQPELRATRRKILEKIKQATILQAEREEKRLTGGKIDKLIAAQMDAEDRKIEGRLDRKFAELSGGPPAASTLTHAN